MTFPNSPHRFPRRVQWLSLTSIIGFAAVSVAAESPATSVTNAVTPEQAAFFESKIRPALVTNCLKCHGASKQAANLRLDSRAALLKGNESGPAVVPGDPDKSLLIKAIRYTDDDLQMPPSGKMKALDIATITEWVKMGAPWPSAKGEEPVKWEKGEYVVKPEQKSFWSFQPIRKTAPPAVKNKVWVKSPIDNFVLAKLEEKGLKPAPAAQRRTLIRRAYFDLIGLPPAPDEVVSFVMDKAPDAYEKLIDRLLASPQYGERWGRRWLDVARYADSNGLDENIAFGNAWRYRDYVIAAFNKDKPYNEFIKEQIAGDLMPAEDDDIRNERITATGFLSLGAKVLAEPDKPKMLMDIVDEQIDTTSKAVMGITVSCARCHDHKFDPIPTKDYYALAGIFKSTRTMVNLNTVAKVYQRPLASKEVGAATKLKQEDVKKAEAEVKKIAGAANADLKVGFKRDAGKYLLAGWELAHQPGLYSVAEKPEKPGDPQRMVIEAEKFNRGNFNRDFEAYGKGIGVIHTANSDFAEWDIAIPAGGSYQLEFRYAAQDARPVRLKLNGKVIMENALGKATGSWGPDGQKWEPQGIFAFEMGKNTLRLEAKGAIPHIDKLLIVAMTMPAGKGEATAPRTAEQIATQHDLNPAVLKAWAKVLHAELENPAFQSWQALGALATMELAAAAEKLALRLADEKDAEFEPLRKAFKDPKGPSALPDKPEAYYPAAAKAMLATANETLKKAQDAVPQLPMTIAVEEAAKIENVKVHIRGSTQNLGDEVPRHFLTFVGAESHPPLSGKSSGRLEFAAWLTSTKHPLTARVAVNRLWQGHFGEGLARVPDNFGKMGEKPSHPELLDWLAATFMENGWSMKKIHRMIMLSNTYRMSSALDGKAYQLDPENRLLWRMNRRRLEVEPFRDALLKVGGNLEPTMGGSLLTAKDADYVTNDQSRDAAQYTAPRRSIYLPVIRNSVFDMFQAFDFGDPSAVNAKRASTTVAPQALYVMNSPFVMEQAKSFASDLLSHTAMTEAQRIRAAYLKAFGRSPEPAETTRATSFLARYSDKLAAIEPDEAKRKLKAWQGFCQVLLASNEFIYVD